MKLIVLLSMAALVAPIAIAQETETPTTASSPTESAAPETSESPAAKSSPSSKQYPTPGISASPAASTTASPTKLTTNHSTAKTTSAAGPIVPKGNPEQQIRQIEDAYEAASVAHNVAMIEPLMADDFVLTDSKNRVMNKRRAVAEFKKDTDTYTTAKNTELKLHPIDRDVYVVTGVAHEAGKDKTGKPFDRRFRFTDTFANRNGKWLVVATHVSTLSQK